MLTFPTWECSINTMAYFLWLYILKLEIVGCSVVRHSPSWPCWESLSIFLINILGVLFSFPFSFFFIFSCQIVWQFWPHWRKDACWEDLGHKFLQHEFFSPIRHQFLQYEFYYCHSFSTCWPQHLHSSPDAFCVFFFSLLYLLER